MAQRKPTKAPAGISFRASAKERAMIDRAAQSKNVGPSDYARQSVMKQVEMDLANESAFVISARDMSAFMTALDAPPQAKPRLRTLLTEKSILD